jgi:hypothetical protein
MYIIYNIHNIYLTFIYAGAVNGLGQSLGALSRAIGPAIGGVMWSLAMKLRFVYMNFIVVVLILMLSQYMDSCLPLSLNRKKQPKFAGEDAGEEGVEDGQEKSEAEWKNGDFGHI